MISIVVPAVVGAQVWWKLFVVVVVVCGGRTKENVVEGSGGTTSKEGIQELNGYGTTG
jgi:hypothetical protein